MIHEVQADAPKTGKGVALVQPEAFVRLHHLWQGNDEKEKPLLRLLKELGLNARVYYGKPALMHIQGSQKDVDAFAGTAERPPSQSSVDCSMILMNDISCIPHPKSGSSKRW